MKTIKQILDSIKKDNTSNSSLFQNLVQLLKALLHKGIDAIGFDEETNTTEIGGNASVDGNLVLHGAENLIDDEGNPLITGGGGSEIIDSEEIVTNETEEGTELLLAQTVSNKINNSLQLPQQAPATHKLVGINTAGAQELVDVPSSGGTQLYYHKINGGAYKVISTRATPYSSFYTMFNDNDFIRCIAYDSIGTGNYSYGTILGCATGPNFTVAKLIKLSISNSGTLVSEIVDRPVITEDVVTPL